MKKQEAFNFNFNFIQIWKYNKRYIGTGLQLARLFEAGQAQKGSNVFNKTLFHLETYHTHTVELKTLYWFLIRLLQKT